ncbi:MAG: PIN domain nuclease [Thiolinea sp.]
MILVDSSVWIDLFRGNATARVHLLNQLLGQEIIAIGDLILAEVLQGVRDEKEFNRVRKLFAELELIQMCDAGIALRAARNFRYLRTLGITVRKTIDTVIATRCIEDDLILLHADRDFDAFIEHLGLRTADTSLS